MTTAEMIPARQSVVLQNMVAALWNNFSLTCQCYTYLKFRFIRQPHLLYYNVKVVFTLKHYVM